ncbi:MAG: hypothetical protein IPM51_03195 [Sphingobacteriaceae bacterium]|nr:hypothetical protein [Sphingobacteriaceae bacterium]
MKNLAIACLAVLMLASCSSKIGIVKRKYNKGYYIAHSGKQKNTTIQSKSQSKVELEKPEVVVINNVPSDEFIQQPVVASINQSPEMKLKAKNFIKKQSKLNNPANPELGYTSTSNQINISKLLKTHDSISLINSKNKKDSDVNIVVLVILSLFPILALIAVYLHDGDITLNFWIDLLLHFILLYWLFAILVVLDIVDLR